MIPWPLVLEALTPDPLEEAKARVQTRVVGAEYRRRKALVHAALKRGVPTEGRSNPAGQRVVP